MIGSCVSRIFLEPQLVPAWAETVAAGTSVVSPLPNLLGVNLMPAYAGLRTLLQIDGRDSGITSPLLAGL